VVEYFAYPEYTSGPKSPVTTGSMVAHEELILVRLHAVAQEDDGTMEARTVCNQPAFFNPQEENKIPGRRPTSPASARSAGPRSMACPSADSRASPWRCNSCQAEPPYSAPPGAGVQHAVTSHAGTMASDCVDMLRSNSLDAARSDSPAQSQDLPRGGL
jgi:hypothetical protein